MGENNFPIAIVNIYFKDGVYYVSPATKNDQGLWVHREPMSENEDLENRLMKAWGLSKNNLTLSSWKDLEVIDSVDIYVSVVWLEDSSIRISSYASDHKFNGQKVWNPVKETSKILKDVDFKSLAEEVKVRLESNKE